MKTEGRNAVLELIRSGKDIDKIYIEKNPTGTLSRVFAEARKNGIKVQVVDKSVLDKNSDTGRHQGVIAFGGDFDYADFMSLAQSDNNDSLVILCDGIEDVHNLGSIIRVAECVGADGVVIPTSHSASVTEAVVRVSAGAANHVNVARVVSVNKAIETLKKNGFWIYGMEADGHDIYETDFSGKIALVVGGEDSGVRRLTRELCDYVISIPMRGRVNSLNASVALGVAAYEITRRRSKG